MLPLLSTVPITSTTFLILTQDENHSPLRVLESRNGVDVDAHIVLEISPARFTPNGRMKHRSITVHSLDGSHDGYHRSNEPVKQTAVYTSNCRFLRHKQQFSAETGNMGAEN